MVATPIHHPSDERLLDYAAGAAAEPVALVIATHLALCSRCRREVQEMDSLGGALLEEIAPEAVSAGCFDRLLARIELAGTHADVEPEPPAASPIDPDLPEPLLSYLDRPLAEQPWRRRGTVSEISLLSEVPLHSTRLLRIRAGTAAPRHTHEGSELTLVLKGSFHDGHGRYCRGDVVEADSGIDHRPIAGSDEDCLCLAVTDAPLKLTSPLGRLINPFIKI